MQDHNASEVEIIDLGDDEDFIRAMRYLHMREFGEPMTKTAIAEEFGIARSTLDRWIREWTESGLLRRCREKFFLPTHLEEIQSVHTEILRRWPDIVRRQIQIAVSSSSDKVSNEAAQWLEERFIAPALEAQEEPGAEEFEYVKGMADVIDRFDPFAIPELPDGQTAAPEQDEKTE